MNGEPPRLSWNWSLAGAAASAALSLAACGSPAVGPAVAPPPASAVTADSAGAAVDVCVVAGSGVGRDTIRIAAIEQIDPARAPLPANDTERLVFRQLYETLIRLDCAGEIRPALAERWSVDRTGLVWTFVLRDAQFADGTSLTASAVRESWLRRGNEGTWPGLGVASVAVAAEQTLVLTLADPHTEVPAWLAEPAFAVAGTNGADSWPGSSGVYRPESAGVAVPRDSATLLPPLAVRGGPGTDPRDLIDAGADLLVTRDATAIQYAAGRPDLLTFALPWDRTYVLVSLTPMGAKLAGEGITGDSAGGARFRSALARDAVSADARGAEPPFWWEAGVRCSTSSGAPASPHGSRLPGGGRVAYPQGDRTARELAARLVALIGTTGTAPLVAAGLSPVAFATSVSAGDAAGFVLPLARRAPASCHDRPAWPAGATVFPLVDTRARLVVRRGAGPITLDADGTPRIIAPSPPPPPPPAPTTGAATP